MELNQLLEMWDVLANTPISLEEMTDLLQERDPARKCQIIFPLEVES